jgi:hypothetical protein
MIFYFISSRLYDRDFRKPLIKALRAEGHTVWHIRIGRTNILTRSDGDVTQFGWAFGFVKLVKYLRSYSHTHKSQLICVESSACAFIVRSILLRASIHGLWCFDIFDNFLYDLRGFRRLKRRLEIFVATLVCPIRIVLSSELLRLVPHAHHLDNAGIAERRPRLEINYRDLVILFSVDSRLDFRLVKQVAGLIPQSKIYLYGRLGSQNRETKLKLDELCIYQNIIYRGEYEFDDVDAILAPFGIGFSPYVTNDFLTEFINPDKFYFFLQSGMEVISTEIPQARKMSEHIHIARSADEVVEIMARIQSDPSCRRNHNFGKDFNWGRRAQEFVDIIQTHVSSNRPAQRVRA